MGVYYTLYVLPEPDFMEYRPNERVLTDVLDLLLELEWALREEAYSVEAGADGGSKETRRVAHADRTEAFGDYIRRRRGFIVRLNGVPDERFWPAGETRREDGLSKKYGLREDETGVFGAQYCDELSVLWSPELVCTPQDAYRDSSVLCPTCGANPQRQIEIDLPELRTLEWCGVNAYPPRECPNCGAVLNLRALWAPSADWDGREPAPFAHVLIAINPAPKATPAESVEADPQLLDRLKAITGVGFRSLGRYS